MNASNEELRAVIRYCVLRGLSHQQTLVEMQSGYGDSVPSFNTIRKWSQRFWGGHTCIFDDERNGRPRDVAIAIEIAEYLKKEPFASVRVISDALDKPRESVRRALTEELGLKKFVSRWVPHLLSDSQKQERIILAGNMLKMISQLNGRLGLIITADESWFFHDYSQDGKWTRSREEVEPRPKRTIGTKKTMIVCFWWYKRSSPPGSSSRTRNIKQRLYV